ncbi:hypothetical protein TNCV_2687731 [Trichonephila clavipes]|nr:hypothetical protein TNCV_2687731 [Trichonephila clavipes]
MMFAHFNSGFLVYMCVKGERIWEAKQDPRIAVISESKLYLYRTKKRASNDERPVIFDTSVTTQRLNSLSFDYNTTKYHRTRTPSAGDATLA